MSSAWNIRRVNGPTAEILHRALAHVELVERLRLVPALLRSNDLCVWEAEQAGSIGGWLVAQTLPGRMASVWPPIAESDELLRLLGDVAGQELALSGVQLMQSLIARDDSSAEQVLKQAGLTFGAELLYMACLRERFRVDSDGGSRIRLLPVCDEPSLRAIIGETYRDSLDCPAIDGLRDPADVLAGYRTCGSSGEKNWRLIEWGGDVVGCLIVSGYMETQSWEITYLGVVPSARGNRLGREATLSLLRDAYYEGVMQVVLAVDVANHPGVKIYRECGFETIDTRKVLLRGLAW